MNQGAKAPCLHFFIYDIYNNTMDNEQQKNLIEFYKKTKPIMDSLKDPAVIDTLKQDKSAIVTDGFITCSMCSKAIPLPELITLNTNLATNIPFTYCKDCTRTIKAEQYWMMVCLKCKQIIMLGTPVTNKHSGFKLEANKIYHVSYCPKCSEDRFKPAEGENDLKPGDAIAFTTIEERAYNNKYNIPNPKH